MATGAIDNYFSAGAGTGTGGASSRTGIAQNFDAFLMLLTTQLRNQNPLEPLNTNEFTQQLVQFAGVEQQLKQNETLQALLLATQGSAPSTAASFIGRTVRAEGISAPLVKGSATWNLNAPRAAASATITVYDANGNVVASRTKALAAGEQTFTWDGKTTTGATAPDGVYAITIAAKDVAGQPVSVSTGVSGVVDGVDLSGTAPVLLIGALRVPLADVQSIVRAGS